MLLFDAGLVVDGYWADLNRMYLGKAPTGMQREAYEQLVQALALGRASAGEGTECSQLARAMLGESEGQLFGRVGHGIGLSLTEPPSLHPIESSVLEAGTTLCLEPNFAIQGTGSVVGEEEIVITASGAEPLSSPFPLEPRVLG